MLIGALIGKLAPVTSTGVFGPPDVGEIARVTVSVAVEVGVSVGVRVSVGVSVDVGV